METEQTSTQIEEELKPNNDFWPFSLIAIFSGIDSVMVGCGFMWIRDNYLPGWNWLFGIVVGTFWFIAALCGIGLIAGTIVHIIHCRTLRKINRKGMEALTGNSVQQHNS